jgi:sporulation protein YlmC with PRC-barrel domain
MADRNNPDFLSASTLKGDKIVNAAGDDLGKIEELMIDLRDGRLAYAVMSFGGFLGMGDKLFAIPWQAFRLKLHDHALVLDVPKETLEKAEGFDKDNWPITSREWLSTVYSYYGYQPYWQTGVAAGMPEETKSQRMARATGRKASGERENPDFLSAGTLKGDKVVGKTGDEIGKIEEFMIDLQNGNVGYVAISHGGFLGIGSKLFAIPWDALALSVHEHAFDLNVSKETLDKAEGFDKDNWPLTREELSRTYSYYGYEPYWQKEMAAPAAGAAAVGAAAMPEKTEPERMARMERERPSPVGSEEERRMPQERERLEELRKTQEEKISDLEKQRIEAEKQAETEREKLRRLETERIEAERQAQTEKQRLVQLEKELQEARRKEETEKVARLEEELMIVQTHEQTHKEKLSELERACTEAQRQAGIEKETLARLEQERIEAERLASTQRERLAQLEREQTEAETMVRAEGMAGREMPDFLSASTIRTDRVINTAGEDLGRIEELMIDLEDGRVAYAIMSFGGFLGMADKRFAIPWDALSPRPHEHAFVLDISRDVLERAEGFDKDNWPSTREQLSRTYTYYGYQPYWQRGAEAGVSRETEPQRTTRTERRGQLDTAEEVIARQEKERLESMGKKETDTETRERLEREKVIAERREHKYK